RYQEYSQRLKELRVALGLQEYRQLDDRLRAATAVLDGLRGLLEERAAQAEAWEAETRRLEAALAELDAAIHEQEGLLATARQQIAAEEPPLGHEWSLAADLETELAGTRSRLAELAGRVATLGGAAAEVAGELRGVEGRGEEQREAVRVLEDDLH